MPHVRAPHPERCEPPMTVKIRHSRVFANPKHFHRGLSLVLCVIPADGCGRQRESELDSRRPRGTDLTICSGSKPICGACWVAACAGGAWDCVPSTGGACSDGDPCTFGDRCDGAGNCVGTPITCTGRDGCFSLFCDGNPTCGRRPVAPGTLCSDGNACSFNDRCDAAGTCAGTSITLCSTTVCGARACDAVTDFVDTIRVDATGKVLVTFKTPL